MGDVRFVSLPNMISSSRHTISLSPSSRANGHPHGPVYRHRPVVGDWVLLCTTYQTSRSSPSRF